MNKEIINIENLNEVDWQEVITVQWQKEDDRKRLSFYVFSHDRLWHLQAPLERLESSNTYRGKVFFGLEENHKGFEYELVAVSSVGALPATFAKIPHNCQRSDIIKVTRKS